MATTFAALIYRSDEIPDRALSQGFAVALGGWDVSSPRLFVAPLPGIPGFSAAYYASGEPARGAFDELEHLSELFEDELSPPVAVLDAAAELGRTDATVFALVYSEEVVHDDGWRFDEGGYLRHFVREGEEGLEAGVETHDRSDVIEVEVELPEGATEQQEAEATDKAIRPHRGSTFLASELGAPVLPALMGGLFAPERRVAVRLVDPAPASIAEEVRRLNRVLRREDGRAAPGVPQPVAGVAAPATYEAFVRTYDWADPTDPQDLYRELAIGLIEGTLRFLREGELRAHGAAPGWAAAAAKGLYPIARLTGSTLGGSAAQAATVALGADGEALWLVRGDAGAMLAGPTFGELVRYLSLGWSRRGDAEEDFIGALMLRARLRALRA